MTNSTNNKPDNYLVGVLSEFSTWCLCDDDSCEKSRNFDQATQAIENFYRNKIPEKKDPRISDAFTNPDIVEGWNDCVDTITAQFNSKGDSDE